MVLVLILAQSAPAPAGADSIADKRAQAAQIARQLEVEGRWVSMLAEDLNEARLRADALGGKIAAATEQVARTGEQVDGVRRLVRNQAVDAYMNGGGAATLELFVRQADVSRSDIRRQYVRTVTASSLDSIDELRAVRLRLDEEQAELAGAHLAARDAVGRVEASRREAASAEAAQKKTLSTVQGELSVLVAAEAQRRAEEQARKAAAEAARKREQELATARAREEAARARLAATAPLAVPALAPRGGVLPAPASGAEAAVAEARRQIGKPYQWGSPGPDSFDCSGLTAWAWKAGGKYLPHSSRAQWSVTTRVPVTEVQTGDLLFYGSPIHHVAIYAGGGQVVEASQTGYPVRIAGMYRNDLVGAGRVN